jgi:hypothetical protein
MITSAMDKFMSREEISEFVIIEKNKVTLILSGQKYTTSSIVLHSCYYLRWKLAQKQKDPIAEKFQATLSYSSEFYMDKYEIFTNPFLCSATFLNPEYRNLGFCTDEEKARVKKTAKSYLLEYYKTIVPDETTSADDSNDSDCSNDSFKKSSQKIKKKKAIINKSEFVASVKSEFELYSKTFSGDTYDKFWLAHEKKFPSLSKFARIVLTPPATSCPSERAFSAASNQIWSRRNRLAASSLEKIMFLLTNLDDEMSHLNLNE